MKTVIRYENISMKYGDSQIIEDFNFTVEQGEFVAIIGTSGCGKTTLLKMLNGLVQPSSGTVYVNDENILHKDIIEHRRDMGYVVQGNALFPHMTVAENIAYVPTLKGRTSKNELDELVSHWLHMVGLDDSFKDRYPDELSGGQQQRVGIARALSASPKILLMDEPFGSVDEITRAQLRLELKQLHQKTHITILLVTHDISEALILGTKVLVLDKGYIHQYDSPQGIQKNPQTDFVKRLVQGFAL